MLCFARKRCIVKDALEKRFNFNQSLMLQGRLSDKDTLPKANTDKEKAGER
jgi:hypothetical protein